MQYFSRTKRCNVKRSCIAASIELPSVIEGDIKYRITRSPIASSAIISARVSILFAAFATRRFPTDELHGRLRRCKWKSKPSFAYSINEKVKFVLQLNCFVLARSLLA